MGLVYKPRQKFRRHYIVGRGMIYKNVYGEGIFGDSMKRIARFLFKGSKSFLKNQVKPRMKILGQEGLDLAKKVIQENKPKIAEVVNKNISNLVEKVIDNPKEIKSHIKETLKETKQDVKDLNIKDNTIQDLKDLAPIIKDRMVSGQGNVISRGQGISKKAKLRKSLNVLNKKKRNKYKFNLIYRNNEVIQPHGNGIKIIK
jgi:ribosomal protein S20